MTGLPSELHASIYERATNPDALDFQRPDLLRFGREGDRIYPLIPELSDVISISDQRIVTLNDPA